MRRTLLALVSTALLVAAAQDSTKAKAKEREPLQVTYLANEGFLVSTEDASTGGASAAKRSFVIDAFVREPYVGYDGLSAEAAKDMEKGTGPFEGVDLALVSHVHRDHFQADFACRALKGLDALIATSPQVLESLEELCAPTDVEEINPAVGEVESLEHQGIEVEFFRLSHGAGRFAEIQNFGHVIELGGWTVLHLGDATMSEAVFAPHDLVGHEIDVAFVPYWYWNDPTGRTIIEKRIQAKHYVAVHIPARDMDRLKGRVKGMKSPPRIFEKALETHTYE